VALLYVGLQEAWLLMAGVILRQDSTPEWVLAGPVQEEARKISEASASREASLTPKHRRAVFQLGYNVGYSAGARGTALMWSDAAKATLNELLVPREQSARDLSGFLGITDLRPLRVNTAAESLRLSDAIEADENGLAARVEAATTPRHRQLYLLGVHTGVVAAQVDIASLLGGQDWPVPPLHIARHATLAGVPRPLWNPLIQVRDGGEPKQVVEAYQRSVLALDEALGDPLTLDATVAR
jgi:hypothetical protein